MWRPRLSLPTPYLISSALLLALCLWLLLGDVQTFRQEPQHSASDSHSLTQVAVTSLRLAPFQGEQVHQGQLDARRRLTLRTDIAGRVLERPVKEGTEVTKGEVLLVLDSESLPEEIAQARTRLELAEAELAAGKSLRQRELISASQQLALQADREGAAATLAELQSRLASTRPDAPFAATLERLDAEPGEWLQVGDRWGELVDDRRLIGRAEVSQQAVDALSLGMKVSARLLDGDRLDGTLTRIARRADDATRSYAIDIAFDNPTRRRLAGRTANFIIPLGERQVHAFSPALLRLDDSGQLAVRHLDEDDRVVESRLTLVSRDTELARVTGLPNPLRLITRGAGLVKVGEAVNPVSADPVSASPPVGSKEP